MYSIENLIDFFGWCSLINFGILLFSTFVVKLYLGPIGNLHAKIFNLKKEQLPLTYYGYLAVYKIMILIFNLVPYLALKIML